LSLLGNFQPGKFYKPGSFERHYPASIQLALVASAVVFWTSGAVLEVIGLQDWQFRDQLPDTGTTIRRRTHKFMY
jgi:hypothetical protein